MNRISVLIFAITLSCFSCSSIKTEKVHSPKLVVTIVVDQLKYDYLTQWSDRFSEAGFNKIQREGFSFHNQNYNYMPTNTGPGHATIFTGANPNHNGIIGNSWYVKSVKSKVNCVGDDFFKILNEPDSKGKSPGRLLMDSYSSLYGTKHPESKSVSISLKDRGAILPGGKNSNGTYWLSKKTGEFITSSYYTSILPSWVTEFNTPNKSDIYLKETWETKHPLDSYSNYASDENEFEESILPNGRTSFPYKMSEVFEKHGYEGIFYSPFGNDILLDFAHEALINEQLGKDSVTDFLNLSFSSTDYVGHNFGPEGVETEDVFIRFDQNLAELIDLLNEEVGEGNYLLVLTSDHGVAKIPNRFTASEEVHYFNGKALLDSANTIVQSLSSTSDKVRLIENFSNNQLFFNTELIDSLGLDSRSLANELKEKLIDFPGVAHVYSREEMKYSQNLDSMGLFIKEGVNSTRSGDVMVIVKNGWLSDYYEEKGGTDHGSPWDYDTHVPLIFYGWSIKPGSSNNISYPKDIAPTIFHLLGEDNSQNFEGRILKELNSTQK